MYHDRQNTSFQPAGSAARRSLALPARFAMFDGLGPEQNSAKLHPAAAGAFAIAGVVAVLTFIEVAFS